MLKADHPQGQLLSGLSFRWLAPGDINPAIGSAALTTYAEATKQEAAVPKAVPIPKSRRIVNYLAERIAVAAGITSRVSHSFYPWRHTQDALRCIEAASVEGRGEDLRDDARIASTRRETVMMRSTETSVKAPRVASGASQNLILIAK